MKTDVFIDISPPIPYLTIFWFSGYWLANQKMKTDVFIYISPPIPYLTIFWFSSYWLANQKMKTDVFIDISPPIPYLTIFWFSSYWLASQLQVSLKCNISRKRGTMKFIFEMQINIEFFFKGALQGLRQFLAHESSLKKMKNAFYLTLKAFFVLKIYNFLS